MSPILERVQQFLTAHELTAHPEGDGEALLAPMNLTHSRCNVIFHHGHGDDELVILGLYPCKVPEDRRAAAAEFYTRLNWNLSGQRFLLDWTDGEVRLRRDVPLLGALDDKALTIWFKSLCALMDGFHPALMNVIYRGMPTVQALEQGEAEFHALLKAADRGKREEG